MVHFTRIYKQNEHIDGPDNDHPTWKSRGHFDWIWALSFIMCKKDPPNLYKIESAKESDKWC
jgi:hypothetical protein